MKTTLTTLALIALASTAYSETLAERVERYNREDQRAVSGTLDGTTLTIVTQDMAEGKPGKGLSPRSFDIDLSDIAGIDGADGKDGTNGSDGRDYYFDLSQASADRALGALQMRTAKAGQWVAGTALTGGQDGPSAGALGIGYGINDDLDFWVSGSTAFEGGGWNLAAGATWVLN